MIKYFVDSEKGVVVSKVSFDYDDVANFILGPVASGINAECKNLSPDKEKTGENMESNYRALVRYMSDVVGNSFFDKTEKIGKARVSPLEEFNANIGADVALNRSLVKYYDEMIEMSDAMKKIADSMSKELQKRIVVAERRRNECLESIENLFEETNE